MFLYHRNRLYHVVSLAHSLSLSLSMPHKLKLYIWPGRNLMLSMLFSITYYNICLQANRTGNSYKVPLSMFYVEEIRDTVHLEEDMCLWFGFSKVEVKSYSPVYVMLQCPQEVYISVVVLIAKITSEHMIPYFLKGWWKNTCHFLPLPVLVDSGLQGKGLHHPFGCNEGTTETRSFDWRSLSTALCSTTVTLETLCTSI